MKTKNFVPAMLAVLLLVPATLAAEDTASPAAGAEESMVDSQWFQIGWPKIEMPKFSWKSEAKPALESSGGNPVSRALDKVADSSRKASQKVRGAWDSTIDRLNSFGGSDETAQQVAQADEPGFWSRLFGSEEPEESRTTQEFLAQERIGMTRR